MSNLNWESYFDNKAQIYGASVKSSDYFDDDSFFMQRDNILNWLGELNSKEILDAGCGVGAFSEPLTKENNVYGVDFSAKSLEYASARGLNIMTGDLTSLKFGANRFDLVLCSGVIQLIEQYRTVIEELARVTMPGGTLLIQTLHEHSVQRKILKVFERQKKFDKMYNMRDLKQLFIQQGFENIEFLKMYHPFTFVTTCNEASKIADIFCTSFAIKGSKKND